MMCCNWLFVVVVVVVLVFVILVPLSVGVRRFLLICKLGCTSSGLLFLESLESIWHIRDRRGRYKSIALLIGIEFTRMLVLFRSCASNGYADLT